MLTHASLVFHPLRLFMRKLCWLLRWFPAFFKFYFEKKIQEEVVADEEEEE